MSDLHIQLLGDFRLVDGDAPVTTVNTPRLQALLAYLLLHAGVAQLRQKIAFLLWPASSEARARNSLRNLLHQLRHALPAVEEWIQTDDETMVWRAGARYTLDVTALDDHLAQATSGDADVAFGLTAFGLVDRNHVGAVGRSRDDHARQPSRWMCWIPHRPGC